MDPIRLSLIYFLEVSGLITFDDSVLNIQRYEVGAKVVGKIFRTFFWNDLYSGCSNRRKMFYNCEIV